jgi:hypothetical protein
MKKLLFSCFGLLSLSVGVNAQATINTATATATVITPISITKQVDMNFGNIATNATGGTVVLLPDGTRSKTSGVTLPATAGTVTAASFTVSGTASATYSITLPSGDLTLTKSGGTETMIANTFTSTPTPTGTLDGTGAQTLKVGATLNVGGSQASGTYVSGTFPVTVNYN